MEGIDVKEKEVYSGAQEDDDEDDDESWAEDSGQTGTHDDDDSGYGESGETGDSDEEGGDLEDDLQKRLKFVGDGNRDRSSTQVKRISNSNGAEE